MNKTAKLSLIAAAMGGLMAGSASRAMASTPAPTVSGKAVVSSTKSLKAVNAGVRALDGDDKAGKHDCKGKNDCKGQGGKSSDNGCKGKNSCKGHGGCKSMGDDKKSDKKE